MRAFTFAGSAAIGILAASAAPALGQDVPRDEPPPAAAADSPSETEWSVSGNVALVSEYRFRGIDLSGGDPALQGGVDAAHSSGFYVGAWASTLDDETIGYGDVEVDAFAGWTGPVGSMTLDVGAIAYLYPDAGAGDFDYYEGYGSLSYSLGPATATGGVAYAPEQDGLGGDDNLYVFGDLSGGVPGTPLTLRAHLGYTDGFLTFTPDGTAFDWSLGADYVLWGPLTAGVAYVGVEGDVPLGAYDLVDDAVVFSLSATF